MLMPYQSLPFHILPYANILVQNFNLYWLKSTDEIAEEKSIWEEWQFS